MSNRTINLDDRLYDYLIRVSLRESPALAALREETRALPESNMQIAPEQGQFMALMVKLLGVRHYIEIGTFTGYSALAVAEALPEDGRIVACDLDVDFTDIAERHWRKAGLANKIDLRIAPAVETLSALLADGKAGRFDMAFIDADKPGYDAYFEHCIELIRTNGLILIDNVLWGGRVAGNDAEDDNTSALRTLNAKLGTDPRIDHSMLPLGDGLTLARKRKDWPRKGNQSTKAKSPVHRRTFNLLTRLLPSYAAHARPTRSPGTPTTLVVESSCLGTGER